MIIGCNHDVPGIAGIPQGSLVVMTDADWAGDVKDRRSYSGIAVWVKGSVENMWYPVYASSKKQNMVCLSSGESELRICETQGCESTHQPRGHEGLLMQAWAMEPGQRILKVHGDSQQVADCLTKKKNSSSSSSQSSWTLTDAAICRTSMGV